MTHKAVFDKPECYHAVCMYSCDACSNCKYDMDCYEHHLNFMLRSKQKCDCLEEGYRRQVEGKIKGIFQFGDECWLGWCSECGKELKGRTKIALILEHRYCPNCGVKMKGGAR